jgi:hypothetical protein
MSKGSTYESNQTEEIHIKAALPLLQVSVRHVRHRRHDPMVEHQAIQAAEGRQGELHGGLADRDVGYVAGDELYLFRVLVLQLLERLGAAGQDDDVVGRLRGEQVFGDGQADAC